MFLNFSLETIVYFMFHHQLEAWTRLMNPILWNQAAKNHFIKQVDHPFYFRFLVVLSFLSFISLVEPLSYPTLKISISGICYHVNFSQLIKMMGLTPLVKYFWYSIIYCSSDAFYFCFVAFCTVGFGGEWVRLSTDFGIWLIVVYIFLGVTLLSTTLHIVHQVCIQKSKNAEH